MLLRREKFLRIMSPVILDKCTLAMNNLVILLAKVW